MIAHEALQKLSQLESRGFDPGLLIAMCTGNLDVEIDEEFFDWIYPYIEIACTGYKAHTEFKERMLETSGIVIEKDYRDESKDNQ